MQLYNINFKKSNEKKFLILCFYNTGFFIIYFKNFFEYIFHIFVVIFTFYGVKSPR